MANPNPDTSGLKPFEPGQSGNPGGKTSAQRKAEVENAEAATRIRTRMLAGLERQLELAMSEADDGHADLEAIKMIEANILRLLKDTEDRGLGTAVQSVNVESPNGTMTPQAITRRVVDPKDGIDD